MNRSFCAIPLPHIVYVGPATKEEFARLKLPELVHDWASDPTHTLLENDGQEWQRRCHSKSLGEFLPGQITVIFQWFEYRPIVVSVAEGGAA